jgi:hypothetical protein
MLSLIDTNKSDELSMKTMKTLHRNHCTKSTYNEREVEVTVTDDDGNPQSKTKTKKVKTGREKKNNYVPLRQFIREFDAPVDRFVGKAKRIKESANQ